MTSDEVTGIMVYYYYVCKRKLWYFIHEIRMENENENVRLGKLLDESTYLRDNKHIMIDGVINLDFLKGSNVIHEIKKSRSIEEAGIMQVKYYLYYLNKKGISDMRAKIDYPLLKRTASVELSEEDIAVLEQVVDEIISISKNESVPLLEQKGICKKCAYFDLCFI